MIKKTTILSLIISTLFLNSCAIGYSVDKTFTPLSTVNCDTTPENVTLFFEGEKIDFEYEKIGLIEIQGEYSSTDAGSCGRRFYFIDRRSRRTFCQARRW